MPCPLIHNATRYLSSILSSKSGAGPLYTVTTHSDSGVSYYVTRRLCNILHNSGFASRLRELNKQELLEVILEFVFPVGADIHKECLIIPPHQKDDFSAFLLTNLLQGRFCVLDRIDFMSVD
jgi:hypothetical protein